MYFFDPLTSNNISVSTREFLKVPKSGGTFLVRKKMKL